MEIINVKEKEPELKIRKETETAVHKGDPAVTKKERHNVRRKVPGSFIPGKRYGEASEKDKCQDSSQENILYEENRKRPLGLLADSAISGKYTPKRFKQQAGNPESRDILTNGQAKEDYHRMLKIRTLSKNPQIRLVKDGSMLRVNKPGGLPAAAQTEGGEGIKKNDPDTERNLWTARTPGRISNQIQPGEAPERTGKNGKTAGQPLRKEAKISRKGLRKKGQNQVSRQWKAQNQAVRQRKLQFMFHKLSGSEEQDSLWQMAKDLIRMKATAVTVKAAQYLGALLAPLSGMVFLAAFPVVLIVVILYCSPIAAFMENPSSDTPSIQEVLGEYYMEFNQEVSANAGENGAVAYLHEKDGNYISNYMDTLMVYMVQYGTGDLGVVMDEKHKRLLKKVFDEMNGFEDQTATATLQAGQSLGNVVTSAYCSCSICCGQWAGGPTASGAMPKAGHTIAVDAADPFVPMGTRVIMGGREYVVEDTGAFARYGVQFDIYFDSHAAASNWGHVTMEAFLADGNENTVTVTKKGSYVKNLNFEDYIATGKLTREQEELLREVMDADFRNEIPSSGTGGDVANLALTKVGCQYSQERRYEEGYYDCSSLIQRCYAQFGIHLPAIASTQGQYMSEHGLEVTEEMLEPGDLIFYSYENNGQFRNISHVAIYIGNGRMVHASSPERGVVNDPFSPSNVGLYGRPGRGK